ncbi:MAG: polysaccharide deacetylase family protein [Geodermatophilaceae bacterium]
MGLLVGLAVGRTDGETAAAESADRSAALTGAAAPVAATPTVLSSVSGIDARWVALTFDDGPDSRYTPEILALLERHHAVATFCMVGDQIRGNEALIREVAAAGMALCDHTRTHDLQLPGRPVEQIISEIVGAQRDLAAVAGAPVNYYRAPGGNWSPTVLEVAATHDMQPLGWSVDTRDWTEPGVQAILDAVDRQLQPGGVILLHDGGGNRDQTLAALEILLPRLVEQGYQFGFPAPFPPSA